MHRVILTDDWHVGAVARAVPGGYYNREVSAWVVDDPTPRSAAVIAKLFPEIAAGDAVLVELAGQLARDSRPFDNATPYDKPIGAPRVRAVLESL